MVLIATGSAAGRDADKDDNEATAAGVTTAEGPPTTTAETNAQAAQTTGAPTTTAELATTAAPSSTTSTTIATTTTIAATTTTLPPVPTVFEGSGDQVVDLGFALTDPMIVTAVNDGSSNFIVYSLGEDLTELELIVNEIGPISGRYPLHFFDDSDPRYLRVEAEGGWRFEIAGVESARLWTGEAAIGTGADVLLYGGGAGILDYSNTGDSNFVVYSYGDDADLLINEIGPVSGTTTITSGPSIVTVDAEGDWSLTVKEI